MSSIREAEIAMLPVQGEGRNQLRSEIPAWLAAEAYAQYSKVHGTDQSFERLHERGGFGRDELLDLLAGGNGAGQALMELRENRNGARFKSWHGLSGMLNQSKTPEER